jgi:thiol-disulfide isomerase/thioredoxin
MQRLSLLFLLLLPSLSMALQAGDPAPEMAIKTLDGNSTSSLADYRGKVVFVDFWASWCPPCRKSIPLLSELHQSLQDKGFTLIAVNEDDDPQLGRDFMEPLKGDFPSLSDPEGKLSSAFGVRGMPTSYLIDNKGIIQWVHEGFSPPEMDNIRQQVNTLLNQP